MLHVIYTLHSLCKCSCREPRSLASKTAMISRCCAVPVQLSQTIPTQELCISSYDTHERAAGPRSWQVPINTILPLCFMPWQQVQLIQQQAFWHYKEEQRGDQGAASLSMSMMTFFNMVSEEACALAGSLLTRCQRSPWRGSAFLISSST